MKRCHICLISLLGLSLTFKHSGNGDWGFKKFLYGILLTLIEHVWLKLVTGKGNSAWRPKCTSAHMTRVTRHILVQLYIPNKIMTPWNSESKCVRNKELHTKTHLIFYDQITIWWVNYTLITNLVHWLLFIHKILFSSTCFEHQVLIFRRIIQLYTCSICYCHSLWVIGGLSTHSLSENSNFVPTGHHELS